MHYLLIGVCRVGDENAIISITVEFDISLIQFSPHTAQFTSFRYF